MKFGCIMAEIMLDKHDPRFSRDCPDMGTRGWARGYQHGYNILKNEKNSFDCWREFKVYFKNKF
jgi:hypothetical protein